MSDRPDDDFDAAVHRALGDVATAIRPDPGLADRLIANARGDDAVVRLDSRRPASRWIAPLLAAAAVVVLAVGGVTAVNLLADSNTKPAHLPPTPNPRPTPTKPFVPEPSVVPHFHTYSMQFADPQHGWALGEAQCPAGKRTNCVTLLATDDGGAKWRQVDVPHGLVSPFVHDGSCMSNGGVTGPCVDQVLFANTSVGYLWGLHEIYVTTDGGRSWSRYQNPITSWVAPSQSVFGFGYRDQLRPPSVVR